MTVGTVRLPGVITEITGADRKWKFDEQKAVGTGGASLVYKGEEIAGSIKVKCSLSTVGDFAALKAARRVLATPKGQKPSAFDVKNAILNNQGIKSVQIKMIGQETYAGAGLWTVEWELGEYNPPKPTATGAATSSKPANDTTPAVAPPTASSAAELQLAALLEKAKAA
jgi:hypothetical protein